MADEGVSFSAQNEIDAEQAFLNSMKTLQEFDNAGGASIHAAIAPEPQDNHSDGMGNDITLSKDNTLIADTKDQSVTPNPEAGSSTSSAHTSPEKSDSPSSLLNQYDPVASHDQPTQNHSIQMLSRPDTAPLSFDGPDNKVQEHQYDERDTFAVIKNEDEKVTENAPDSNAVSTPNSTVSSGHNLSATISLPDSQLRSSTSVVVPEHPSTQTSTPLPISNEPLQSTKDVTQTSQDVVSNQAKELTPSVAVETVVTTNNGSTSSNKRKRLPQDKVGLLEDRISEDPRGDVDAWKALIDEYQKKGKFDEARDVFERFFAVFPACVSKISIFFCAFLSGFQPNPNPALRLM